MIALNALSQTAALGAVLLIQTAYLFLVARFLGPEDFGWFAFAWSITQMMLVGGDLGTHNTTLRWLAGERRPAAEVVPVFLAVKGAIAAGLLVLVLGLALFLNVPDAVRWALALFGAGMWLQSMSTALNVVHQAYDRLYLASLNIFLIFSAQGVLGITFLLLGGRVTHLASAYVLAVAIATAINLGFYRYHRHPFRFRLNGAGTFLRSSLAVGLATVFQTIANRIAIPLVTFLAGPYHAGIYSAALRFPQAFSNLPIGIFSAVFPSLAARPSGTLAFQRLFRRTLFTMLLVALPATAAFYLTAPWLVRWIYGPEFLEAVPVLRILAWIVLPLFAGMTFSQVLLSRKELVSRLPWLAALALAVNLALGYVLIPRYLAPGAAWALLLTEVVLALAYAAAAWSHVRLQPDLQEWAPGGTSEHPRIAVVVQRYGPEVIGGAEILAREIARRLSRLYRVDVLTSCARDYRTWADAFPEGVGEEDGVRVLRFPVAQQRHWRLFGRFSGLLFAWNRHLPLPRFLERRWVVAQGPATPDLVQFLRKFGDRYEAIVFFGYLYYPTVFGLPAVADRSVLVTQVHDEPPTHFRIYRELLGRPRFIVFMTEAERELVHRRFPVQGIPGVVTGYGVEVKEGEEQAGSEGVDLLYLGRIEVGKGCGELFDFCRRAGVELTAVGPAQTAVPPHVRYRGVVSDEEKERLLRACRAVVVPSLMESLSMAALEAWAHGKPVIAKKGGVVETLVRESGGGICYEGFEEFRAAVRQVDAAMGERGRRFVAERYSWERIVGGFVQAIEAVRRDRSR
ncbi:MAG: hypothetical protein Kow00109_22030 [Acidobacteriota bacterium]